MIVTSCSGFLDSAHQADVWWSCVFSSVSLCWGSSWSRTTCLRLEYREYSQHVHDSRKSPFSSSFLALLNYVNLKLVSKGLWGVRNVILMASCCLIIEIPFKIVASGAIGPHGNLLILSWKPRPAMRLLQGRCTSWRPSRCMAIHVIQGRVKNRSHSYKRFPALAQKTTLNGHMDKDCLHETTLLRSNSSWTFESWRFDYRAEMNEPKQ